MNGRRASSPQLLSSTLLLLVWTAPALAASPPPFTPPVRYGDPVNLPARSPLAHRVEELALKIGREVGAKGSSAPPLGVDRRLEAALDLLLAKLPPGEAPPSGLSEQALVLTGLVEPAPYLLTMHVPAGAEDDAEVQLGRLLPPVIGQGRYRRVAVSTLPTADGASRLALALQESFVELAPVPRALPAGGRAALTGRVLPPFGPPALYVTAPDGTVTHLESGGRREPRGAFHATFTCGPRPGAYQVEVTAEDRFGDTVLANFPVACGVAAPAELPPLDRVERGGAPVADRNLPPDKLRDEIEARVFELLRRDRAAAGAPPLALDARLSSVARAHSAEMRDARFFGHLSPTTGSAMDRLTRAGVVVLRVRENLGRDVSAVGLDRGLMNSPSHRANMLATDVDRAGIGVAVGARDEASGTCDLFLTQLFVRLPAPFDAARLESALRERVGQTRQAESAPPLVTDAALDGVAREVAARLAAGNSGQLPRGEDPIERALPTLSNRFLWVRKVSAKALDVSQLTATPALVDKSATHAGYAVAAGKPEPGNGTPIWLVVLLAARR